MTETAAEELGEVTGSPEATREPSFARTVTYVLDASALLCLINDEPGAARVAHALSSSVISAVNLAEVATKLNELGADAKTALALLAPLHLTVAPFNEAAAFTIGALCSATRDSGLSLGDRTCLALAASRDATVLTTNKSWVEVSEWIGVAVEMLRYPRQTSGRRNEVDIRPSEAGDARITSSQLIIVDEKPLLVC